ncbi:C-type lectin domain family 19 member A-like [Diadema antillarum]|uniref:C-type lectin domain family 19 member A-like n=1 Tax=Diadema antillarum TaxID=105358 RepID=UPI003A86278B
MNRAAVIFMIVFAWVQIGASGCCPEFWTQYGSYCYRSIAQRKTWTAAGSSCRSFGAELASVHSSAENDFVYDLWSLPNKHADAGFWIGLNDVSNENNFAYSDGTAYDYQHWAPGEPNNDDNEDCIHLWKNTKEWNDRECSSELAYVCKMALE